MAIRKNDIVTNKYTLTVGVYDTTVIPVGTELRVWKTTRAGTIYCTTVDRNIYHSNIVTTANLLTKVEKPLPTINVGDIFVCSWGYDQTNIDYYKVIAVKNKTVSIVAIGQSRTYTGHMQGECNPIPDVVTSKPITKRINRCSDGVNLKMTSYSWAYPWNGETNHFTEWA